MRIRVALLIVALLGACGNGDEASPPDTTTTTTSSSATSASTTTTPTTSVPTSTSITTTTSPVSKRRVPVYFVRNERLAPLPRELAGSLDATALLRLLFAGVQADETALGYLTSIPAGSAVRAVTINADRAVVDVSKTFESGGGSYSVRSRVAQVVYTLNRAYGVSLVTFHVEGQAVITLSSEGLIATNVRPSEFEDMLPNIVVDAPLMNDTLGPAFTFRGLANVFEGTVNFELLDAAGKRLKEGFATGAMGFWGQFAERVNITIPVAGRGTFIAFTYSPEDGRRRDVTTIPVHLNPTYVAPPSTCSAATTSPSVSAQSGLPVAVAAMRSEIARAASRCDYAALADLANRNGPGLIYSFGSNPGADPTDFWRVAEEGGHSVPPMFALRKLLDASFATMRLDDGSTVYVWPELHGLRTPTAAQLEAVAALGVYSIETLQSMFKAGAGYLGYRVLITESADWTAFVAGD